MNITSPSIVVMGMFSPLVLSIAIWLLGQAFALQSHLVDPSKREQLQDLVDTRTTHQTPTSPAYL